MVRDELIRSLALLAGLLAPHLSLAGYCEPRNPDGFKAGKELQKFFEDAVAEFFPYQKGWEKGYNKYFSHDVKATFNDTRYDFDGLKGTASHKLSICAYMSPLADAMLGFFKNRAYPILHDGFNGTFVSLHGFQVPLTTDLSADSTQGIWLYRSHGCTLPRSDPRGLGDRYWMGVRSAPWQPGSALERHECGLLHRRGVRRLQVTIHGMAGKQQLGLHLT